MCKTLTPLDTTIKKVKEYIAQNEASDPMYCAVSVELVRLHISQR